ncbi:MULTISPECIES: hypothetical protein [unclassified Clostridioides]|uniref:hypothetical protein n=1 Tax=unclassified Clostridioides TaxID=2635829 RepID=UPI001D10B81F|nr:hypothetical protein [Clostridioides sp. ES-S-0049-03]MCC0675348.1 hypothetical protein [Clostridioides sp. ES-W-0018-02]MCC0709843.1 hypothetical protein [Clostridioides sp. ES-W-0017-02]
MNNLNNIEEAFYKEEYEKFLLGRRIKAKASFSNINSKLNDEYCNLESKDNIVEDDIFTNNNEVLNMKISAQSPLDTDIDYGEKIIKNLFKNIKNLNIRTTIQDDRKDITSEEIESVISKIIE